jgi:hypothetical protein
VAILTAVGVAVGVHGTGVAAPPSRAPAAVAAVPGKPRVLPAAWPSEVVTAWPAHARSVGHTGASLEPACREQAPDLQLCLVIEEQGRRRLATVADVLPLGGFRAALDAGRAAAGGAAAGFVAQVVPETKGTFHLRSQGDGLDTALLGRPDLLHAAFGSGAVVAFPDQGTTLAWIAGDAELDTILAVAVRRAWEVAERPVSPRVYRWDGERWREWGQARPAAPSAP